MTYEERECYLMVVTADYLMRRWKKNMQQFLIMDEQYGILNFILLGYEPFHLTGEQGVAEEVEAFIREQGGVI